MKQLRIQMNHPIEMTKFPTVRSLLTHTHPRINLSDYAGFRGEKYRQKFTRSMFDSLLKHRVVEITEKLEVGGGLHSFHFYVVLGSGAVIYRGADDDFLSIPILCRDYEALGYEMSLWRRRAGFEPDYNMPVITGPMTDEDLDRIAEAWVAGRLKDTFIDQLDAMDKRLEAVALSEA
jgi:hypothetical protein